MNQHENRESLGARNIRGMNAHLLNKSSHIPQRAKKVGGGRRDWRDLPQIQGLEDRKSSYCEKSTKFHLVPLPSKNKKPETKDERSKTPVALRTQVKSQAEGKEQKKSPPSLEGKEEKNIWNLLLVVLHHWDKTGLLTM